MLSVNHLDLKRYFRKVLNIALPVAGCTAALVGWIASIPTVTGARELLFWNEIIISNKNFLFFFNAMLIAGFGGYLSSFYKHKPLIRVCILIMTWVVVFTVLFITSKSLPFRIGG